MQRDVGLVDFLHLLWLGRWRLIVGMVLGLIVGLYLALFSTPMYHGKVIFAPASNDNASQLSSIARQFEGLLPMGGLASGGQSIEAEAAATLRSRQFTEAFIRQHNLMPVLFKARWDANQQAWKDAEEAPTYDDAYAKFNRMVRRLSQDKSTGLYTLQIEWKDPEVAARWANDMIAELNQRLRQQAIAEANDSIQFLEAELAKTNYVDLRQAIYRLIETQVNQKMLANVNKEYAFKVIDPATPSDADRYVSPNKKLNVILGLMVGFVFGLIWVLCRQFWLRHRSDILR